MKPMRSSATCLLYTSRLLPGGTRKKRSRKKAQLQVGTTGAATATDIANAANRAEAAGGTREGRVQEEDLPGSEVAVGEEAEHPGAQTGESANRIGSNRGNARIDSNPQSTRSEESVKPDDEGEIAAVVEIEEIEEPVPEPPALSLIHIYILAGVLNGALGGRRHVLHLQVLDVHAAVLLRERMRRLPVEILSNATNLSV